MFDYNIDHFYKSEPVVNRGSILEFIWGTAHVEQDPRGPGRPAEMDLGNLSAHPSLIPAEVSGRRSLSFHWVHIV